MNPDNPPLVSVHGGHSGQFCTHAENTLEEVIKAYIDRGFIWVGITEHMAPCGDGFLYDDERQAGLDATVLQSRFRDYFDTCRALQTKYQDQIEIFVAFETEIYSGSEGSVREYINECAPQYIVGSLHHVGDISIDTSPEDYSKAADALGGLDNLYCHYFEEQHAMLHSLRPSVVGHFDLVRMFDPDYKVRLRKPAIWELVTRNLDTIMEYDLILDLNLRGFDRITAEQYPSRDIIAAALDRGIAIVPGDDSHGVDTVGRHFQRGVDLLKELGANLEWKKPKLLTNTAE
jgi:histidinol-phosphatase (PHP family)